MNRKELKQMLVSAANLQGTENFSAFDTNVAASKALAEHLGIKDFDERSLRHLNPSDYAILEEVIDELVPTRIEDVLGHVADIKTFGYQEQVVFTIKGIGSERFKRVIKQGAQGGIYQSRRLDNSNLTVDTFFETAAVQVTLEELLTGRHTINEYMAQLTIGFLERIYIMTVQALRAAAATAPAVNQVTSAGADFDTTGLDEVIRIVAAYGTPHIMAFESMANAISNVSSLNANGLEIVGTSRHDWDDIREYGRVMKYKGRTITVLPNFLVDNTNEGWVFKENEMFILPADEKPVKIAFHGPSYIKPNEYAGGGMELNVSRKLGVAVLFNNSIGSLKNTEIGLDGLY